MSEEKQHVGSLSGEESAGLVVSALREYAVSVLSPEGVVLSWNRGAEEIMGYSPVEVVGQHVSIFYTPEQIRAGHPTRLLTEAAELGSCTDEGWRVRKDGSWFWANVVTTSLWSENGTLRGFARVSRDDTYSHDRLEWSLRQFRDLFALTPVAIGRFDRYGSVLDANTALCELFGYTSVDILSADVTDLINPDEPSRNMATEAFRSGEPPEDESIEEWSMVRADGRPLRCGVHITRSVGADREPFWWVVFQDVTERYEQTREWHHRATHDEMTGLPNRVAVTERFSGTDLGGVAVLYCDIDYFKRINESLGHEAGDELLLAVGRRLRAELPDEWVVARPAGDEYVIVCPDVTAEGGADQVASRVRGLLTTALPLHGVPVHVTASVGVSVGDSVSGVNDLVRFASAAVLDAKAAGRNRISFAGPELITSVDHKVQMESELREAIDSDALTVAYQPIVAGDGMIISAEALVRWHHPVRGVLSPGVFLPIAEEGGLMHALDQWVLRTALHDASGWPELPTGEPVAVSVNLGALSPADPDFINVVSDLVTESGFRWDRLIIELVETSLIDFSEQAAAVMRSLSERGVKFAVDDFGTGYSSLSRLKTLPVQVIKVDRSLVGGVATSEWNVAVVKAVSDLARAMRCRCTAEGVETVDQLEVLRGIRVNTYQGWLFSHAVTSPQLARLIESGAFSPPG